MQGVILGRHANERGRWHDVALEQPLSIGWSTTLRHDRTENSLGRRLMPKRINRESHRLRLAVAGGHRGDHGARPPDRGQVGLPASQVRLLGDHQAPSQARALAGKSVSGDPPRARRAQPGTVTVSPLWRHGPCNH
jgi:hypothetical protein